MEVYSSKKKSSNKVNTSRSQTKVVQRASMKHIDNRPEYSKALQLQSIATELLA